MLLHLFYRLQPSSRAYVSSAVSTTFFLTFSDRKPILRESRNCLGKSNPFSAIQFTTPTLSYNLSYARSQARGGRNTNQISTSRKRRLDAVIQQQSFHITIPPCCKSSDKIRYRSPLTKPYLSEGETLNIKGYLQSRPAFY